MQHNDGILVIESHPYMLVYPSCGTQNRGSKTNYKIHRNGKTLFERIKVYINVSIIVSSNQNVSD